MNRKQLIVMWVAIGAIGLMLLFPPWRFRYETYDEQALYNGHQTPIVEELTSGPYSFIFQGPPDHPRYSLPGQDMVARWKVEIDWVRLLLPIGVIVILAAGFTVTFRERKPPSS